MTPGEAIHRLAGLQAQTTHTWYTALWSRLDPFDPDAAGRMLEERELVRIGLMRSTIHLVSARDCLWMRPLHDAVMRKPLSNFKRNLERIELEEIAAAGREILEAEPLIWADLGRRLQERWPGRDGASLAQVPRALLALVQIPPRGVWGKSGPAAHTTAQSWLGEELQTEPGIEQLVRRYLAAFGPASIMDAQAWCGITRLKAVFEGMREELIAFTAEDDRELYDLPDAPRPGEDVPAPVRFLPDYDNLVLSHADRSRFDPGGLRAGIWTTREAIPGCVLIDGLIAASWAIAYDKDGATLTIRLGRPISGSERRQAEEEGERLLAFAAAGAGRRVVRFDGEG